MPASPPNSEQLDHARTRSRSAKELCAQARTRVRSASHRIVQSRARLGVTPSDAEEDNANVVVLPVSRRATAAAARDDAELAPVLLLAPTPMRAPPKTTLEAARSSSHASILHRILWDFGADEARAMVEAALALMTPLNGHDIGPELAAMQAWLAEHPG